MSCEDETIQALKESRSQAHATAPDGPLRGKTRRWTRHGGADPGPCEGSYPYIDVSTVYRTLSVLKQMRLVSETDMGGGESTYEWIEQARHHHLICRGCDRVTLLDHKYLASLGTELLEDCGFQADIDHFAIFGLCEECLQNAQDS